MKIVQINRQKHFGGGEVYTQFLTEALAELGYESIILTHPAASFWGAITHLTPVTIAPCKSDSDVANAILELYKDDQDICVLSHGPMPRSVLLSLPTGIAKLALCHMPIQGRNPRVYDDHDLVIPVSTWVLTGLLDANLPCWREPLLGVAKVLPFSDAGILNLRKNSRFSWDTRKVRDRACGWVEPLVQRFIPEKKFRKRAGLTIGVVSRITPIKQFPVLMRHLVPIFKARPQVHLEIFGSGGFDSVYDLWKVLRPISSQVRWWGHQPQSVIGNVYRNIDCLLTGLPEKEALGLNVIEAQAYGTTVLAPNAPPFIETIKQDHGGWLFTDPRIDQGRHFATLVDRFIDEPGLLESAPAPSHLEKFSKSAFKGRVQRLMNAIYSGPQLPAQHQSSILDRRTG